MPDKKHNGRIIKRSGKQLTGADRGERMSAKRAAWVALPILIAIAVMAGLYIHSSVSYTSTSYAQNGILNLAEWNKNGAFEVTGEWEFYWDKLLTGTQLESGMEAPVIVSAPGEWNYYETELGELPGFGHATYRLHVTGAQPGTEYGIRIQNMASAYKLYIDKTLLAQNGTFGDRADAPVSSYRPQLAAFTPQSDSFNIILQISNDAYAVGGMWEPLIFGTAGQVSGFDSALSAVGMATLGGVVCICLFFFIFYAARQQERDVLILAGIGALMLVRLTLYGDSPITYILPNMPISGFGWIDYLTLIWIQFLLLYFVYCTYGNIVRKWQVAALLAYCAAVTLAVILLPFATIASAYNVMNIILLLVIAEVTAQLGRAAWRGQPDAPMLFFSLSFILALIFYGMFVEDWSTGFYLLTGSAVEYMILFTAQCVIVARRYHRAQQLEISFLKGQIRPHFIHNSLTGIAASVRTDPARARELLQDMSSYLRGFYDYDSDDLITLSRELALVRAYVSIEQMRFGDKIQVEYDIEADNILLPPLILQPLVENAFVHGLREKEGGGTVVVYARRVKKTKARIGVRDNGLGYGVRPSALGRQSVGIENINRRLSKLYRTQLGFAVPEGGGCEAYMEIPWKEAKADARVPH